MTIIDFIIILVLIYGAARGYCTGIFSQMSAIVGIVLGTWAAYLFSEKVAIWLNIQDQNEVLIFIGVLLSVMIVVMLLTKAVDKMVQSMGISFPFRVMGAAFSVLKMILILAVVLNGYLFVMKYFDKTVNKQVDQSYCYKPLMSINKLIFPYLEKALNRIYTPEVEKAVNEAIEEKTEEQIETKLKEIEPGAEFQL